MARARSREAQDRELVQFLLAEQSLMQSTLAGTISETGSRVTSFLAALSGAVVAISFIAQVSGFAEVGRIFALVLLPALLFLGLVTFERLLQLYMLETLCYRGMNRIRHFFTDRLPDAQAWVTMSSFDDLTGVSRTAGSHRLKPGADAKQILISAPGTIAVIDAIIFGVIAALVASQAGASLVASSVVGGLAGIILLALLLIHELRAFASAQRLDPVRFPSPGEGIAMPSFLRRVTGFDDAALAPPATTAAAAATPESGTKDRA